MKKADGFKESLNLPNTSFPMKARLNETEPKIIQKWEDIKIHEKVLKANKDHPIYFLPDGPPYANAPIHLGHVLNKILKDIVIKYKNLLGFKAPFLPVWDCHGLPIEMSTLKEIPKKEQESVSSEELRHRCHKQALFWVEQQKAAFKRLGVLARWDQSLLTMDTHYEAEEIRALADIVDKGLLYRGKKPVFWCFKLQTALAFSEAEYREQKSPSICVAFDLDKKSQKSFPSTKPISVVIWTTTPWTLPANSGICLHPDFDYGLYEREERSYLMAASRKDFFEEQTGLALAAPKALFKGKDFKGLTTEHPFIDRKSPLVLGDYVTDSSGTGCVHTAPGHGLEDWQTGQKFQLKMFSPVDEKGHFDKSVPEDLQGLFIFKGNRIIIEKLKTSGHLLSEKEIEHSYPYSPRSNSPLIYRLTEQWFLNLNEGQPSLKDQALKASDLKIHFVPKWGKPRLDSMLSSSPDWCLSRQRLWGVPLPVFYCESCDTPYIDSRLIRQIADRVEESGIAYYFSSSVKELLPKGTKCCSCGKSDFRKGEDILDVWFDSGILHRVLRRSYPFPADLFLEGSDQHRGWFQTSLFSSLAIDGQIPFKRLLTHGFVNDSQGLKMSKSRGNGIDPMDVINKKGAEILRLWVASEDFSKDIRAGEESFKRVTETYRRFRNTFRFLLGNISDFQWEKSAVPFRRLSSVDRWMLLKLNRLVRDSVSHYESFTFYKVYQDLNCFFTVDLSSLYLDIIKDRLYTFAPDSLERRSAQTVLFHLTRKLLPLMSPLTSFLSEEVYEHFSCPDKKESVFLESFPSVNSEWKDETVEPLFERLFPLRNQLNQQLETLRAEGQIGSSLQARAVITSVEEFLSERELCEFFSVSKVAIEKQKPESIKAFLAEGKKCLRCWFYSVSLNSKKLCPKCIKNLKG